MLSLCAYFAFHLDSKVSETFEYPLQYCCYLYGLLWLSILIQGIFVIQYFVINLAICLSIMLTGMWFHRSFNYLVRRNLPIIMLMTVYWEIYADLAEHFTSQWQYTRIFFLIFIVVFLAGKLPTMFKILNISNQPFNDEVWVSVLMSMRICQFVLMGYKPIRNPFRINKLNVLMNTSNQTAEIQFIILSGLSLMLMTLTRILSIMLMRKEEKKALFEEYYTYIEEYEGQSLKENDISRKQSTHLSSENGKQ